MRTTLKATYLFLILAMALSACAPQAAPTAAPAANPTSAPAAAQPAAAQKIKVALVLPGTINDNGWSQVAYDGVTAGAKATGAEVAYTESAQLPDFESIFRDYANKGYNLVIGHGSEYADVAIKIGKEFPKTYFAVTNADVKAENVAGLDTKNEEAGYIAGFIAGTVSKSKKVGIVGAMEIVAMKRAAEGFVLGVKASCPDCKAMSSWVGSFDDVGKGKETAMAMIEQGVDVLYANADAAGMGVIAGCKEKGVMVVGDTGDQSSLAPDLVVTSSMQNLNPMFVEIITEVANGKFVPNNVRMNGFDTGIYFLAPLNKKLVSDAQSASILAEVEKVKNNKVNLPHMSASAQPPAATPQKIKVALVLPGTINDNGWSQVAYDGVTAGAKETGAEVAYTESAQLPDFESIFRDYANKGYNLVIGHGSEYADVAIKIGKEFPKTYFGVTNADVKAENVAGLDTKNEEAGYIAGFIAGTVSKSKKVGIVGAMEIVAMKRAAEGFVLGVKASCPDCKAMSSWVGSFDDVGKGKETAMAMIEQGVDVLYANADAAGMGVIAGCKEKGVMVVGDTGDQSTLAPDLVVTSSMQNLNPMFVEIITEVANGKFVPNNVRMNGFDTGIYFLAPLNKKLVSDAQSASILAEVEKVKNNKVNLPHMSASSQ